MLQTRTSTKRFRFSVEFFIQKTNKLSLQLFINDVLTGKSKQISLRSTTCQSEGNQKINSLFLSLIRWKSAPVACVPVSIINSMCNLFLLIDICNGEFSCPLATSDKTRSSLARKYEDDFVLPFIGGEPLNKDRRHKKVCCKPSRLVFHFLIAWWWIIYPSFSFSSFFWSLVSISGNYHVGCWSIKQPM